MSKNTTDFYVKDKDGIEILNPHFCGNWHTGQVGKDQYTANIERPRATSAMGKKAIEKQNAERRLRGELEKIRTKKAFVPSTGRAHNMKFKK